MNSNPPKTITMIITRIITIMIINKSNINARNTDEAMNTLKAQAAELVYVLPAVDFLKEVTFSMTRPDEKGNGNRLLERAQSALHRATITRSENLLMIAIKKNDSKTKKRVGEVTAELTGKVKKPWSELIDGRIKQLADGALAQSDGGAGSGAAAASSPATPRAAELPPTKKSKKTKSDKK